MLMAIVGAIFIMGVGSVLHFAYEWSHHNKLVGFFAAVNESTWEHLKLLIAPSYLWLVVEYFVYDGDLALFLAHLLGLVAGLIIIPLLFYGYQAIVKRDIAWVDILTFILAAAFEQVVFYWLMQILPQNELVKNIGIFGLIILFIVYLTQTYAPTKNFLSRDPITHRYGVRGHWDGKMGRQKSRK